MANLYLVNDAKFRPFSFDEMLKPALMATQAHQDLEEAYNTLDTQANAIGSLASETDDPIAYAQYKAYEDSLRAQAADLAANGLNVTSRQNMLNMRGRYAKDIVPIQNAIERRRKLADEQMKATLANPTLMYQRNFNTRSYDTSLDRFLEDPDYGYGDVASGALITQQAATQAGALAKKLSSIGKGKLDSYTSTFIQHYGLSPADIAAFNSNPRDPKANKVLRAIYDNVYNAVPKSIRSQYSTDVDSYIGMGLYSAIGEDRMGTYENFGARQALQHAYRLAEMDYQNKLNKPTPSPGIPSGLTEIAVGGATTPQVATSQIAAKYRRIGIGNISSSKIRVPVGKSKVVMNPGAGAYTSMPERNIEANLFVRSQGNRLKTRGEFIKDGKDAEEKKALGSYYDTYVQPILNQYNNGTAKGANSVNLYQAFKYETSNAAKTSTSTYISAIDLPSKDIEQGMNRLKNYTVWELGTKDGDWVKQKKAGTLNDIINEANTNKGHIDAYASVSGTPDNPYSRRGLVFTTGDKQYFMPFEEIRKSEIPYINQTIDMMLDAYNRKRNDQFNDAKATLITQLNNLGGLSYETPSVKTLDQQVSSKY